MTKLKKIMPYKKRKENFQPNVITNNRQEMNLYERRLFALVVNQVDRKEIIRQDFDLVFQIPIKEVSGENIIPYHDIKKTVESLQSKRIISENEGIKALTSSVIFPNIEYNKDGNGLISLELNHKLVPYFIELSNQYIKYDLDTYLSFSSVFSQRLYELILMYYLRQKPKNKPFSLAITYLQNHLQCNYPNFADFKRRALEPAKKELLAKAGLDFEYSVSKKEGKKIIELEFKVKSGLENIKNNFVSYETVKEDIKNQKQLDFETTFNFYNEASQEDKRAILNQELINYSLNTKQKEKILVSESLQKIFIETDIKIKCSVIEPNNATAYMASALGFTKKK
jgi:hypothetical protein